MSYKNLHTGKAENPVASQCRKLDASVVKQVLKEQEDFWRAVVSCPHWKA